MVVGNNSRTYTKKTTVPKIWDFFLRNLSENYFYVVRRKDRRGGTLIISFFFYVSEYEMKYDSEWNGKREATLMSN